MQRSAMMVDQAMIQVFRDDIRIELNINDHPKTVWSLR